MAIAYLLKANPLSLSKPRVEKFHGNLRSIESIKFTRSSRFSSVKVESSVNSTSVSTIKSSTDFDEHFKAIPSSKGSSSSSSSTFEKTTIINSILKALKWFKIPAVVIFLLLMMMCGRDSAWSRTGGVMGGDSFSSSSSSTRSGGVMGGDSFSSSSSSDDDDHSYSSTSWSGWGHETSTPYSPPPHSSDDDDHSYSSWSGWGHETSTPSSPPPSSYHYESKVVMPNNEPGQYMSHKSSANLGEEDSVEFYGSVVTAILISVIFILCIYLVYPMLIAPPNAVTRSVKAPVPRRDAVTRSVRVHVPRREAITRSAKVPVPQLDAITRSGEAHTRIIKIQVGLQFHETIKDALNTIATTVDTSTSSGFIHILQRTAITLSHGDMYFMAVHSSVQVCNSIKDAKKLFKKLSDEEREKFDKETLVNLNDTKYKNEADTNSPTTINNVNVADTYMVVTILVAAKGKGTLDFPSSIRSANHLKRALEDLESISKSAEIQAVNVFWTPQDENETMSREQLYNEYPELRELEKDY